MEPFELSVSQVNFEEKDLSEGDSLSSFNNLVSYDSDFKEEDREGIPVKARILKQSPNTSGEGHVSSLGEYIQEESRDHFLQNYYTDAYVNQAQPYKYDSPQLAGNHAYPVPPVVRESVTKDGGKQVSDYHRTEKSMTLDPTGDSFDAFTETVEALALQKSVIGNSSVTPASADEVARVIAETRRKMKGQDRKDTVDSPVPYSEDISKDEEGSLLISMVQHDEDGLPWQPRETPGDLPGQGQGHRKDVTSNGVNSVVGNGVIPSSDDGAPPGLSAGDAPVRGRSGSESSSQSDRSSSQQKHLIRVPKERITTTVEKASSSSWFSSRKPGTNPRGKPPAKGGGEEREGQGQGQGQDQRQGKGSPTPNAGGDAIEHAHASGPSHFREAEAPDVSLAGAVAPVVDGSAHAPNAAPRDDVGETQMPQDPRSQRKVTSASSDPSVKVAKSSPERGAFHTAQHSRGLIPGAAVSPRRESDDSITDASSVDVPGMTTSTPVRQTSTTLPAEVTSQNTQRNVIRQTQTATRTTEGSYREGNVQLQTQVSSHKERIVDIKTNVIRTVEVVKERPEFGEVPRLDLSSEVDHGTSDYLTGELDRALRAKAKLEGQIEVLEAETRSVIKERAELQAQVGALQQQVKVGESSARAIQTERDASIADMETLRSNRGRLELVIMDARKLLEDKDSDLKTLDEDLKLAKEGEDKLQAKIKDLKREIQTKDVTVQDMKGKIAELYVDFQTSNQNKILAEGEIRSLMSELKSLAMAKSWYQDQLQLVQESKAQLQKDMTKVKGEMIAQSTMIERLKVDNVRAKKQLTEAEQRALMEKERLARHLEAIESQMMDREASFAQIQHQKDSVEAMLQARLERGKEELSGEMAQEVKRAQNELRRRQAHISVMEHEQAQLVKRLTMAQESILERDKTIESVDRKAVDAEVQLKQTELAMQGLENDIAKLKEDKSGLEVELSAAREEKKAFDLALQTLKEDMSKVEKSFKHMKQDLSKKQEDLVELQADRNSLRTKLEERNVEHERLSKTQATTVMMKEKGRSSGSQTDPGLFYGEDEVPEVHGLHKEVDMQKAEMQILRASKAALEKDLEALKHSTTVAMEELHAQRSAAEANHAQLKQQVDMSKRTTDETQMEGAKIQSELSRELQSLRDENEALLAALGKTKAEVKDIKTLERQMSELQAVNAQLQSHIEATSKTDRPPWQVVRVDATGADASTGQEGELAQKLSAVEEQISQLQLERNQLHSDLTSLGVATSPRTDDDKEMAELRQRLDEVVAERDQVRKSLDHEQENRLLEIPEDIAAVRNEVKDLKRENGILKGQLSEQKSSEDKVVTQLTEQLQEVRHAKLDFEKKVTSADLASESQRITDLTERMAQLEQEKHRLQEEARSAHDSVAKDLEEVQQQLRLVQEEKAGLQEKLAQVSQSESSAVSLLRLQLTEVEEERGRLEVELAGSRVEQETLSQLQVKNTDLRSRVAELERESHKEIAKQKAKALALGKNLELATKEHKEEIMGLRHSVDDVTERLAAAEEAKARLEEELHTVQGRFSLDLDEKTAQLQQEIQLIRLELKTVTEEKLTIESEVREVFQRREVDEEAYRKHIADLEAELRAAGEVLERHRGREDQLRQLELDLEKERGKLAGVQQSHSALKDHTSSLEAALARSESSSVQMSSHVEDELQRREREAGQLRERVEQLEEALEQEKRAVKDAKKQLMTEKGAHVKVRRQLEGLQRDHDVISGEVGGQAEHVATLGEELHKVRESDKKHRAELERLATEFRRVSDERDGYRGEVEERRARDPVVAERLQSLEWLVGEKTAEIEALQEQLRVVEERQNMETGTLTKTLQTSSTELSQIREDLLIAKTEKIQLQAKVSDLKGALRASVQHTKLIASQTKEMADFEAPPLPFDLAALERLLQDTTPVTVQSKPLSFLQATLTGLRGEISGLQQEVSAHTMAVQSSSQAWKELEAQVRDLRDVCKTSAADRAASDKIVLGSIEMTARGAPLPQTPAAAPSTGGDNDLPPPLPTIAPELLASVETSSS